MAYFPPQVEVKQTQKTFSPSLISPSLVPVVVGPAYFVEELNSAVASPYTVFSGNQTTITLNNFETGMTLDTASVYVDFVMDKTGTTVYPVGSRLILSSGLTFSGNQVIIPASGLWTGASVYIGYRALRTDLSVPLLYESLEDVMAEMGNVTSMNPLGLSLVSSLNNGNAATYAYATQADDYSGVTASGTVGAWHTAAQEAFSSLEVYTFAPATVDEAILGTYKTHVNTMSLPTEKRERIVIGAPKIAWVNAGAPAENKAATALAMSIKPAAISDKRVAYVFPDTAFVRERRHISTLHPTYIEHMYSGGFNVATKAYVDQRITFTANNAVTAYKSYTLRPTAGIGVEIDLTLWTALHSHAMEVGDPYFYAFIPVPSSVTLTPSIAGQIAGLPPQQPLTNLAVAGVSSVKYCTDWFSESQVNTIASGGTYIMKQTKPTTALSCRHQLSTNMGSIEARELSITRTVDYVSKFVRSVAAPFIGRYVINKATLDMITMAIKGAGAILVRDGVLNGFTLGSLAQDVVSKDTVLVSISILPPYPVNYIKIELIF